MANLQNLIPITFKLFNLDTLYSRLVVMVILVLTRELVSDISRFLPFIQIYVHHFEANASLLTVCMH